MCGIISILDSFGAPPVASTHAIRGAQLLGRLAHRGPDGRGGVTLSRGWLGHTRLSIVDPSGVGQPFAVGDVMSVANAEIFNHRDLRTIYGGQPADSDCSVIGPVWTKLGDRAPAALDGQFAFVSVDAATGRWIARSRGYLPPLPRPPSRRHVVVRVRDEGTSRRLRNHRDRSAGACLGVGRERCRAIEVVRTGVGTRGSHRCT